MAENFNEYASGHSDFLKNGARNPGPSKYNPLCFVGFISKLILKHNSLIKHKHKACGFYETFGGLINPIDPYTRCQTDLENIGIYGIYKATQSLMKPACFVLRFYEALLGF